MKVYDCFTFYNEFEILELRLKALWDVVDYFVIVEANKTQAGEAKIFNFWTRQDDFKEFLPKIRFIPADLSNVPFKGTGDWSIENAQRNAIMHGLIDAEPDDLIMISDADEIPAPDVFQRLHENKLTVVGFCVTPPLVKKEQFGFPAQLIIPAIDFLENSAFALQQIHHYYYFDWVSKDPWFGTILVKRKNLSTPQALRKLRHVLPRCMDGGRHFAYMGGIERVVKKYASTVEGKMELVKSGGKLADKKYVEELILESGKGHKVDHLPDAKITPVDVRQINLPHIDEFLKKYPHFLREPEKYFEEQPDGTNDV